MVKHTNVYYLVIPCLCFTRVIVNGQNGTLRLFARFSVDRYSI